MDNYREITPEIKALFKDNFGIELSSDNIRHTQGLEEIILLSVNFSIESFQDFLNELKEEAEQLQKDIDQNGQSSLKRR